MICHPPVHAYAVGCSTRCEHFDFTAFCCVSRFCTRLRCASFPGVFVLCGANASGIARALSANVTRYGALAPPSSESKRCRECRIPGLLSLPFSPPPVLHSARKGGFFFPAQPFVQAILPTVDAIPLPALWISPLPPGGENFFLVALFGLLLEVRRYRYGVFQREKNERNEKEKTQRLWCQ